MIEIPIVRPDNIKAIEKDFGTTIAAAIWQKTINNHAWVERNIPIGFILNFHRDLQPVTGPPLPPPDPDIWRFCNGSLISDSDSPLNGQNVPDFTTLFLKGASGAEFLTGGQSNVSLQHTHVITQVDNRQPDFQGDDNDDLISGNLHGHPVTNDWAPTEDIVPVHFQYHAFVRFK